MFQTIEVEESAKKPENASSGDDLLDSARRIQAVVEGGEGNGGQFDWSARKGVG